jgi:hypothetical protein
MNPLCQDPATGAYTQIQRYAKGYPGIRQLQVLQGAGSQGIVASVCPAQITDPSARDYGYTPAIGAIVEQLKQKLIGQCLNRSLRPDDAGHVTCIAIEARKGDGGACCDGKTRLDVSATYAGAVEQAKTDPITAEDDCFCEIPQLSGDDLKACRDDVSPVPVNASGGPVDGWCYVDETVGAPALLEGCPSGEKQKIRFVGKGQPAQGANTFITCTGTGTN